MHHGTFAVTRATTVGRLQKKVDALLADANRIAFDSLANMRAGPPACFFGRSVPSYCSIETHVGDCENSLATSAVRSRPKCVALKSPGRIQVSAGGLRATAAVEGRRD